MNLRSVVVVMLGAAGCGGARPAPTAPAQLGIGAPMPAGCGLVTLRGPHEPPRAILARTAAELAAEVACPGGPSLAERLKVDFHVHHVAVVTITTHGGLAFLSELEDDGATLTVIASQGGGGCSGTEYYEQATFTILVPANERAIRIELAPSTSASATPCQQASR